MGIPDHLTCLLRNLYAGQERKKESEVIQSCLTLWRPHGLLPTRLLYPWDHRNCKRVPEKHLLLFYWASQVAQLAKNSPAMQETWVLSLG